MRGEFRFILFVFSFFLVWGDENCERFWFCGFSVGDVGVKGSGEDGLFIRRRWDGGDIIGVVDGDVVREFLRLLRVLRVLVVEVLDVGWIDNGMYIFGYEDKVN